MGSMFRSALFKLTAVYAAFVMSISVIFSALLYKFATSELQTGFQNQYIRWLTEYRAYGLRQPINPASELAARSHHIFAELVYLNILLFVFTAAAAYLLARRTLRPIERAHEQQIRFTSDVSHELRTPLTALTMDTEVTLLDIKATKDDLRHTLRGNLDEAKRMETLVDSLLQLTSMEAHKLRNEFSRVNVKDVATAALEVVKKLADSRTIHIDATLTDGFVIGNSGNLTQLVVILAENAIKYSPEGSEVRVVTSSTPQTVTILVEDSGPGIAADALPHVFDRFYRANDARTGEGTSGFGLGLSLAKLIADLHNGEIIMSSTEGKGTRALVRLPAAPRRQRLR